MISALPPPDEAERLRALDAYDVLDSDPEQAFDELTKLASSICGTPIALVSLVDSERQWFKSKLGLGASETPRNIAFCAHAILEREMFIVEDATVDPRFFDNPLVCDAPNLRFYAATQLRTRRGHALGTLCVLDHVARNLSSSQLEALHILGRQVEAQLELRRTIRELRARERNLERTRSEGDELRAFLMHDLKNALGMVIPNAEYLCETGRQLGPDAEADADARSAVTDIRDAALRMLQMVKHHVAENQGAGRLVAQPEPLDLGTLVEDVARQARRRIEDSGRVLQVKAGLTPGFRGDRELLCRALENLLENAAKHAGRRATQITIESRGDDTGALLIVSDDGVGVPESERERLLRTGTRLGEDGAAHSNSRGLGLSFCRSVAEAHGGRIWIEESAQGGAAFRMRLPLGRAMSMRP